jgi:hypothetical protein
MYCLPIWKQPLSGPKWRGKKALRFQSPGLVVKAEQLGHCKDKHTFMKTGDFKALAYVLALATALLGVVFGIYEMLT